MEREILTKTFYLYYNKSMIEIKNVSKDYGQKKAVLNLTLSIEKGQVFGLLGPNGAGKTTLLKMMVGILKPTSGDILLNGHSIVQDSFQAKKTFGYVPDSPDMFLGMKGMDYLFFIASIYQVDKETALTRIENLSKRFHLYDALGELIINYSHGMRQKIFLIASLLSDPENWILDEPLTGLDPEAAFEVKKMMREFALQGKTVLFSTHVLDVAEKVCDQVGILSKGELLFSGSVEELRNKEKLNQGDLENLFLNLTR